MLKTLAAVVALLVPGTALADEPTATTPPAPPPTPAHEPVATSVIVINPAPPGAQPEGDEVSDRYNRPEFLAGAIVFAGAYGASAIAAGSSARPGADHLYVPVLGPWLALNDETSAADKALLVGDGILQAASLVVMVDAVFRPTHHRVARGSAGRDLHISPKHNGITFWGTF